MKDRLSKYPGRVKLTPVEGQANTFDMIRADEPEEAGTPINKNTLLKDETAEAMGLDPASDPTPDDALKKIIQKYDPKVGDIVETVRTDLDDRWVLCNGDIVPEGEYPELREKLFYNTEWRVFDRPSDYNRVRPTRRPGEWVFLNFGNNSTPAAYAKVYNVSTETWTSITCPKVTTDYSYGIFGLTWDGSRYIMGVMEDSYSADYIGTMFLFTSTDLKNWTQKYNFKNSVNYMQGYDLTSDGENTIVMEYGYTYIGAGYSVFATVYSVNKAMTKHTSIVNSSGDYSDYALIPAPDGYWGMTYPYTTDSGDAYVAAIIRAGSTSIFSGAQSQSGHAIAFFSDRYMMSVRGYETYSFGPYQTRIGDLTNKKSSFINWEDVIGGNEYAYMECCTYDRSAREWVFYFKTNTQKFYAAHISEDANPGDVTQYRAEQIEALPERAYNDQMAPDRAVLHNAFLRDPNLKYLPAHDGDTYKYIYRGGDEA